MAEAPAYPIVLQPLSEEEGGGFLAIVPDLYGCMSDGETAAEAAENVLLAIAEWRDEMVRLGRPIPEPGSAAAMFKEEQNGLLDIIREQDKLIGEQERLISVQEQSFARLQGEVEALKRRAMALLEPREAEADQWIVRALVPARRIALLRSRERDRQH